VTSINDAAIQRALVRYLANGGDDRDAAHEMYHDDAVLEFPQSGERFVGKQTIRDWREHYPSKTRFNLRRISGEGGTWIAEILISYDGGPWKFGSGLYQFRGDKVIHEAVYVMDGFDARRVAGAVGDAVRPVWLPFRRPSGARTGRSGSTHRDGAQAVRLGSPLTPVT
jgi:hypothetical protein